MKTATLFVFSILLAFSSHASLQASQWSSQMTRGEALNSSKGVILENSDKLISPDSFRPPVEITIVAKTDSTNLRMGYAADQVIFNWELDGSQLRVDGGPADGRHVKG